MVSYPAQSDTELPGGVNSCPCGTWGGKREIEKGKREKCKMVKGIEVGKKRRAGK